MRLVFVSGLLAFAATARADEPAGFVPGYANDLSFSVMAVADATATFADHVLPDASGGVMIRFGLSGVVIGIGLDASTGPAGEVRLSLGYAIPLSRRVALSPALQGGLSFAAALRGLNVGVDLPVTVFLTRSFFLEPFVFGGYLRSYGDYALLRGGLRAGFCF